MTRFNTKKVSSRCVRCPSRTHASRESLPTARPQHPSDSTQATCAVTAPGWWAPAPTCPPPAPPLPCSPQCRDRLLTSFLHTQKIPLTGKIVEMSLASRMGGGGLPSARLGFTLRFRGSGFPGRPPGPGALWVVQVIQRRREGAGVSLVLGAGASPGKGPRLHPGSWAPVLGCTQHMRVHCPADSKSNGSGEEQGRCSSHERCPVLRGEGPLRTAGPMGGAPLPRGCGRASCTPAGGGDVEGAQQGETAGPRGGQEGWARPQRPPEPSTVWGLGAPGVETGLFHLRL